MDEFRFPPACIVRTARPLIEFLLHEAILERMVEQFLGEIARPVAEFDQVDRMADHVDSPRDASYVPVNNKPDQVSLAASVAKLADLPARHTPWKHRDYAWYAIQSPEVFNGNKGDAYRGCAGCEPL
jgi:hypothetical protein